MIHIRMGQQDTLLHPIIPRNQFPKKRLHLLGVERVAAVHKQIRSPAFYDGRVAAAGRLDQDDAGLLRHRMVGDPWVKGTGPAVGKELGKAADAVKGLVG